MKHYLVTARVMGMPRVIAFKTDKTFTDYTHFFVSDTVCKTALGSQAISNTLQEVNVFEYGEAVNSGHVKVVDDTPELYAKLIENVNKAWNKASPQTHANLHGVMMEVTPYAKETV